MYKCKFFKLQELVSESTYSKRGERAWELFTHEALRTIDTIRTLFGEKITINNWLWGGSFHHRGHRMASFYDNLSYSQHLRGNAFDFDVENHTSEEARGKIIFWKQNGFFLDFLTGIELNTGWVHIDCRESDRLDEDGLFLF